MAVTTITNKGQVTIPKAIRDSLGLREGDRIEFIIQDNKEAIVRPITKKVDELFGKLHDPKQEAVSVEKIDALLTKKLKGTFK